MRREDALVAGPNPMAGPSAPRVTRPREPAQAATANPSLPTVPTSARMTASGSSFGPGTYRGRPCRPNVNAQGSFNSPRCACAAAKSGCGANPRPAANATAPCTRCCASSSGARSPRPGNAMKYARANEASWRLRISSGPMTFFTPRQNVSTRYPAHADLMAATRPRDKHESDARRAVGTEIHVIPPVAPLDDQLATPPGAD